jgi:2'-5' RNA ligase
MRLFLAVDLDDAARAAMAAEQSRIAKAVDRRALPKFVKADQMHMTLVFLGEVDAPQSRDLIEAMQTRLQQPSFDAVFDGIGMFPPREAPKILWIGVTAGAHELIALQQEVAARAQALGFPLEKRPFQPHLTIGRWRDGRPRDRAAIRAVPPAAVNARVHIVCVTLYQSRLSPAGPAYTPLARANLS